MSSIPQTTLNLFTQKRKLLNNYDNKMTIKNEENEQQEQPKGKETKETRKGTENAVFIGGKPFMNYVTGVVMQFTTKNAKEVKIISRGKFISKAVDVAEVVRKRFLKEEKISVKDIKINSEEFENKEGRKVNVSTIEITLKK